MDVFSSIGSYFCHQGVCINSVIQGDLAEQELKHIVELFLELDEDQDGQLSFSDLQYLLYSLNLCDGIVQQLLAPYNRWSIEKVLELLKQVPALDLSSTESGSNGSPPGSFISASSSVQPRRNIKSQTFSWTKKTDGTKDERATIDVVGGGSVNSSSGSVGGTASYSSSEGSSSRSGSSEILRPQGSNPVVVRPFKGEEKTESASAIGPAEASVASGASGSGSGNGSGCKVANTLSFLSSPFSPRKNNHSSKEEKETEKNKDKEKEKQKKGKEREKEKEKQKEKEKGKEKEKEREEKIERKVSPKTLRFVPEQIITDQPTSYSSLPTFNEDEEREKEREREKARPRSMSCPQVLPKSEIEKGQKKVGSRIGRGKEKEKEKEREMLEREKEREKAKGKEKVDTFPSSNSPITYTSSTTSTSSTSSPLSPSSSPPQDNLLQSGTSSSQLRESSPSNQSLNQNSILGKTKFESSSILPRPELTTTVNPEHERLCKEFRDNIILGKQFHLLSLYVPEGGPICSIGDGQPRRVDLEQIFKDRTEQEVTITDLRSVGNELFFRMKYKGKENGTLVEFDAFNKWTIEEGKVVRVAKAGSGIKMEEGLCQWLAKRKQQEVEKEKLRGKNQQGGKKEKHKSRWKYHFSKERMRERDREREEREKEKEKDDEAPGKQEWQRLSQYLQRERLKDLKTLPFVLVPPDELQLLCPGFGGERDQQKIKQINVMKRFNSRKLPHLLEIENYYGEKVKYIFKQDDDISMDAAVMKLFAKSNEIWKSKGSAARIRTYQVIACNDLSGFVEVVPGSTMLRKSWEEICKECGEEPSHWEAFYSSLLGVVVTTCAFDITDRHHNNVMFTPDCDVALIDLSASLGKEAPLDLALNMNPVYFPRRLRKVLENFFLIRQSYEFSNDLKAWEDMEEDATTAYFQLYNSRELRALLQQVHVDFQMPTPDKFLSYLKSREFDPQKKEKTRNMIVEKMDNSTTINRMIAGLTSILSVN